MPEEMEMVEGIDYEVVDSPKDDKTMDELETLCRPLIKYLNDNYHPHVKLTIHPTGYELMEGLKANGNIEDYILD